MCAKFFLILKNIKKGQGIFNLGRGIFENTTSPIENPIEKPWQKAYTI